MITLKFDRLPSVEILKQCEEVTLEISGDEATDLKEGMDFLNDLICIIRHVMPENTPDSHVLGVIRMAVKGEAINMQQEEPK